MAKKEDINKKTKEEKEITKEPVETNDSKDTEVSNEVDDIKEETETENEESCEEIKEEETDPRDAQIADLKDKLLRNQAEFENFRRRNEKEKLEMYGSGAMKVIEKILPVVDNFERGLDTADDSPFAEGIKMIYKQLMTSLEELGVTEIEALGETFNPDLHNAVMHEESEEAGEQEITQVLQKGYKYHDSVVRFAMVKVAN